LEKQESQPLGSQVPVLILLQNDKKQFFIDSSKINNYPNNLISLRLSHSDTSTLCYLECPHGIVIKSQLQSAAALSTWLVQPVCNKPVVGAPSFNEFYAADITSKLMLVLRNRKTVDDVEIDMVPIMNMFLVLIPFLLIFSKLNGAWSSFRRLAGAPSSFSSIQV